jgi:hypothetical protein
MLNNRRQFLKSLLMTGAVMAHPRVVLANDPAAFAGKFVVTLQARGGWDVTCFCDPKENQSGVEPITQWSQTERTQTAGKIAYAPFAKNRAFFERHHRNILIINGVDAQTNAHSIGETANWSGRLADGYPSLTALYAAANAPHLPMTYLSFGAWSKAAALLRPTMLGHSVTQMRGFMLAGRDDRGQTLVDPTVWSLIRTLHADDMQRTLADDTLLETGKRSRTAYLQALNSSDALSEFAKSLPSNNEFQTLSRGNQLINQVHFALLAFKAGVSVSADLVDGGYDTHANNDAQQSTRLSGLTDAIDYLWQYAETLGIAQRIVLIVGSDFSRTPHYNSGNGKDHWPVGSYMVMEQGASYTDRVIGKTDEVQNAISLDLSTLNPSAHGSVKLQPSHVQKALRRYLNLETATVTRAFPLINTEQVDFFS